MQQRTAPCGPKVLRRFRLAQVGRIGRAPIRGVSSIRHGPWIRRGLLFGLAASCGGCAGPVDSPREPYTPLPPVATAAEPAPAAAGPFRVAEGWQWTETLPTAGRAATRGRRDGETARGLGGRRGGRSAVGEVVPGSAQSAGGDVVRSALGEGKLGLFPARRFRFATGRCDDCDATPEAALWWFRDEIVAVPRKSPQEAAGAARGAVVPAASSAPAGSAAPAERNPAPPAEDSDPPPLPPLIWIGAPQVVERTQLSRDARTLTANGRRLPLAVTPKIPTNTAYVDASTAEFFAARPVRVRGAAADGADGPTFVARTIWPEDARLDAASLALAPLRENETLGTLVEAQASAAGGAFRSRLLFERNPAGERRWAGLPVLALVLSGAQGDDDGASGGHIAVATGVLGEDGDWNDWLVNNFYPLADASPKGILAATGPIDNYLLDLNSGQLYYRPAYMLVAVLRRPRAASAVQGALQEAMLRFYCRDIDFELASFNSTAMTMDSLRGIGWRVPRTGPTSRILGVLGTPIAALAARSFSRARDYFAALVEERTRLLPRVAFEVAGHDLLYLAAAGAAAGASPGASAEGRAAENTLSSMERWLAEDLEAILFVRLPQVPSSRRYGTYPVRSLLDYAADRMADPLPYEGAPEAGTRAPPERLEGACRAGADVMR